MTKAVGICFRENGKIYFFDPKSIKLKIDDKVLVETKLGEELGTVKSINREIDETKLKEPLKKIIRIASEEDKKHEIENQKQEKKAFEIFKTKIKEYNLEMNLVEVKYLFDNSKLIFYFTAENRIDFRELVKDLASIFKTRIELRQISTRDQVKRLCGNGICGRELCCCTFLKSFDGVTIKMAKEQNLSLNASKITGNCGRLMCCLRYEQNVYEEKMKHLPNPGAIVETNEGEGIVDSVEVLRELIKVKLKDEEGNSYFKKYLPTDLKIIKDDKKSNKIDNENTEDIKELKKLEAMDKIDKKNANEDEDI